MSYLFIIDPPEKLNFKKDTSIYLIKTFLKNNKKVFFTTKKNITLKTNGAITVNAFKIKNIKDSFMISSTEKKLISFFKKIFIRIDPPFDQDYLNLTYLLSHRKFGKEEIINHPSAIRNFNEKLSILQFKKIIPKTLISNNFDELKNFIKINKKVILKPIDGMAGNGIFFITPRDPNHNVILESMTNNQTKMIVAQKFIPEINKGDKRIIIINGNPLPFGLLRIPIKNEVRANLAKGGNSKVVKLNKRDRLIVETIKPFLIENKLLFVGIDIIGDYLTEINVTSPTGLVEIARESKSDIEKIILYELS